MNDVINLTQLNDKTRYIDLSEYAENIEITGTWKGDRIVFKGAVDKKITLMNCVIETTRTEPDQNAIAFSDDCINLQIWSVSSKIIGGLVFWGELHNVSLYSLNIYYPNIAIHIAQDLACSNVLIKNCVITAARREGVYFGPHTRRKTVATNVAVVNCRFEFCGWDAIQVNATNVEIYDNVIMDCATVAEKYQDYGITIQPGSLAYIDDNKFFNTPKEIQVLDSRVFFHRKPKQ